MTSAPERESQSRKVRISMKPPTAGGSVILPDGALKYDQSCNESSNNASWSWGPWRQVRGSKLGSIVSRSILPQGESQAFSPDHLTAAEAREIASSKRDAIYRAPRLLQLFEWPPFEAALVSVIIFNICLVCVETDHEAAGLTVPLWVELTNSFLICLYTFESGVRIYAFRMAFFYNAGNMLDMAVVASDLVALMLRTVFHSEVPATLGVLRFLRLVRLCKAVRVLRKIPQAHLMISGIFMAMKSIVCGMMALMLILVPCSILAVQIIHPVNKRVEMTGYYDDMNCERCPRAFATVMDASLTLFQQIIAGDSWGQVTIPIIETAPESCLFFFPVFTAIGLGVMNLITAVIVDTAHQVHLRDDVYLAEKKDLNFREAAGSLYVMCCSLDADNSGSLSERELLEGFDNNADFQAVMKAMDVKRADMEVVFAILDNDHSGDVSYSEFVEQLHLMKSHDSHTLLMFIKTYVTDVRHKLVEHLQVMKDQIISRIEEDEAQLLRRLLVERGGQRLDPELLSLHEAAAIVAPARGGRGSVLSFPETRHASLSRDPARLSSPNKDTLTNLSQRDGLQRTHQSGHSGTQGLLALRPSGEAPRVFESSCEDSRTTELTTGSIVEVFNEEDEFRGSGTPSSVSTVHGEGLDRPPPSFSPRYFEAVAPVLRLPPARPERSLARPNQTAKQSLHPPGTAAGQYRLTAGTEGQLAGTSNTASTAASIRGGAAVMRS